MNKLFNVTNKIIKKPSLVFMYLDSFGLFKNMDDEKYLKKIYKIRFDKELDLNNPKTFNEKLQWLKLFDRKDIYSDMVDKYEAKKFVANKIDDSIIIPTIGIYDKFDDLDFSKFPNQFVIKCTHDSGGPIIIKDKKSININDIRKKINKRLKYNYFYNCREWPYKNVKPRIIVEKYIKDELIDDLRDYKFMCFNGEPKYVYITVKSKNIFENYYDMNFNPVNIDHGFPKSNIEFKKPKNFNKMIEIARKLSKDVPFLRVDLHNNNGKILFGEMTFYDWAGLKPYLDNSDDEFGKMLKLK